MDRASLQFHVGDLGDAGLALDVLGKAWLNDFKVEAQQLLAFAEREEGIGLKLTLRKCQVLQLRQCRQLLHALVTESPRSEICHIHVTTVLRDVSE